MNARFLLPGATRAVLPALPTVLAVVTSSLLFILFLHYRASLRLRPAG
jgi:simple sugar transport system permease protein